MRSTSFAIVICGMFALTACSSTEPNTSADSIGTESEALRPTSRGLVGPNERVEGRTYEQWTSEWMQWTIQTPAANHPLPDTTGINCAAGQHGPVFFLAGDTTGTGTVRNCTIKGRKHLFFPVINAWCDAISDGTTTQAASAACAKAIQDPTTYATVELDGRPLRVDHVRFRFVAPYSFVLPDGNLYQSWGKTAPAGTTGDGVNDGVYVMLEPLSEGTHTLHFKGDGSGTTSTGAQFVEDILYHLTIVR